MNNALPALAIDFTLDELQALDKTLGIARANLQRKAADMNGSRHADTAISDLGHITSASHKVLSLLSAAA